MNRVLWAEDNDDDAFLMERAFKMAQIPNLLFRVTDGRQVIAYLTGQEPFSDRQEYPLPRFLLLDIKMPYMSVLEVLGWFSDLAGPNLEELRKAQTALLGLSPRSFRCAPSEVLLLARGKWIDHMGC